MPKDNTPISVEPSEYLVTSWTTADGLPANFIKSIYQTSDGYIWASTFFGLARFDGTEWVTFIREMTPDWHIDEVLVMCEMASGDLWVSGRSDSLTVIQVIPQKDRGRSFLYAPEIKRLTCFDQGNALVHDHHGLTIYGDSVTTISGSDTLSTHVLSHAIVDKKKQLWLNFYDGLFRYDISQKTITEYSEVQGLKRGAWQDKTQRYSEKIAFVFEDHAGRLFFASDARVQLFDGTSFTTVFEPNNISSTNGIANLTYMPVSRFWTAGVAHLYTVSDSLEVVADLIGEQGEPIAYVRQVFEDSRRKTWLSVNNNLQEGGLYQLRDGSLHRMEVDNVDVGIVSHIFEDREANLWLATNAGVAKLTRRKGRAITKEQGLWDNEVYALLEGNDGAMWMGTWGSGVHVYQDGELSGFNTHHGLISNFVRSLWKDADGSIVVGADMGLSVIHPDQRITNFHYPSPEYSRALLRTSNGELMIGGNKTVSLFSNGGFVPQLDESTGAVHSLLEDGSGDLWAAADKGLFRRINGAWKRVNHPRAPQEHVLSLRASPDGNVWIGTRYDGLFRKLDQGYFQYLAAHGLPSQTVMQTFEDARGGFWITTENGLVLLQKEDLVRVAEGTRDSFEATLFSAHDGLAYEEFSLSPNSIEEDTSGALWFASQGGVIIVESQEKYRNTILPHVDIQSLMVNGKAIARGVSNLTLSRNNHVEFKAASLSFTSPVNNRLRGRLVGFDAEWIENDTGVFEYINVPAGRYIFEVMGSNNDGVWSERVEAYTLSIQAPLVERSFFWPLIVLFVVTPIAVLIHQVQRRNKSERELAHQRAINEQHLTRERIRRSLHSGVLNTMSTIHLSLDLASQLEGITDEEQHMFRAHKELTYGLSQQMRESMWLLDRGEDRLKDLVQAMKKAFKKAILLQQAAFDDLAVEGDVALTPLQKLNIFLIFREAVQNSVKYSEGECISVTVSFTDGTLTMKVSDDGRGFDKRLATGNGLLIMKAQAKEIGGVLEIESAPHVGTLVLLQVPLT